MAADELLFLSGTVLHALLASLLMAHFRLRVKANVLAVGKAKTRYTWLCLPLGIGMGIGLGGIIDFLDISSGGHGEIYIAIFLGNLMLAGALILVGRIIIGWVPMRW